MAQIATSILGIKDDYNKIKIIDETDTNYIHLDIMDGVFVTNKTYTIEEIIKINKIITKPKDVHLMVEHPLIYIESYSKIKPEFITFHLECSDDINEVIKEIKKYKIKVGISIKPKTNIEKILPYLNQIDLVLVMSVEPGEGGQVFLDKSLKKIKLLKDYINQNYLKTLIEVDGGINNITSKLCKNKGVDILVAGSYITRSNNYQEQINKLR